MPRPLRSQIVFPGGVYHVLARGNNKMKTFRDEDDYGFYRDLLLAAASKHKVEVHHYALMPNHVHLLVKPTSDLSSFMHAVQMPYAKRYCRNYDFHGHVWQGRYKSPPVTTDAYLFACGNYIEMNPVRAGMVDSPEKWPHSSYRVYAFGKVDPLVTIDPFYPSLGSTAEMRQRTYRETIAATRFSPDPLVPGTAVPGT